MRTLRASVLFLFAVFCTGSLLSQELPRVRSLFEKAAEEETASTELLELLEPIKLRQPLLYGYKGAALMVSARYPVNPFKKLSRFNKGRKLLDAAISADSQAVELRFLRLAIQKNTPGFLGYSEDIRGDTRFLEKALPEVKDRFLAEQITIQLKENENAV